MTPVLPCSECGSPLAANALGALCPRCVLSGLLRSQSSLDEFIDCGDRDLLAGVLGLQLRILSAESFVTATDKCEVLPYFDLVKRLLELEALTPQEAELLRRVAEEFIRQSEGSVTGALSRLGKSINMPQLGDPFSDPPPPERIVAAIHSAQGIGSEYARVSAVIEIPGRYTDKRELTRGGMGRIFITHDEFLLRDVVLKELVPIPESRGSADSTPMSAGELTARFLREARLTGQLEHPSIVPVYELGERTDGTPYYTMKFVRGRTLAKLLSHAESLEERMRYLPHYLDLCQAIAYAHSRNVIHRDIKPANVMIGEFGETVVIDWGLAKVVEDNEPSEWKLSGPVIDPIPKYEDPGSTSRGLLIGTPHYMSPEQASGKINAIDTRSDVYSLGVVLFELLTGEVPFKSDTPQDVLERTRAALTTPSLAQAREAPPELISICRWALSPSPDDRYPSARELADDVERFMTGAMVQAYHYTPLKLLAHAYGKNRLWLNAAALVLIGAAISAGISYYNIRGARNDAIAARDVAEANRVRAEMAQANADEARSLAEQARHDAEFGQYGANIRLARDSIEHGKPTEARSALESAPEAFRHWEWSYLANVAWPEADAARKFERPAVIVGNSSADYWRNAAPQLLTTITAAGADITGVGFLADGTRISTKSLDGSAAIWNLSTQEREVLFEGEDPYYGSLIVSPDERYGARSIGAKSVGLFDAATGALLRELHGHTEIALPIGFSRDGALLATIGYDQRAMIWNVADGSLAAQVHGEPAFWGSGRMGRFFGQFDETSGHFYSIHDHSVIRVFDASGSVVAQYDFPEDPRYSLEAISPNNTIALLASYESGVAVGRSVATGEVLWRIRARPIPDSVSYKFSPDSTLLAVRTDEDSVLLFALDDVPDVATGFLNPVVTFTHLSTFKHQDCVAFDASGQLIAIPERDGSVRVYAPSPAAVVGAETVLPHPDTVLHARFETDSRYVVSASFDGKIRRWDLDSGRVVRELQVHDGPVINLLNSPDRSLWSSRGEDGYRVLTDIQDGKQLLRRAALTPRQQAGGARGPLIRVGASQASRRIMTQDNALWLLAGEPGTLQVIDIASGEARSRLEGHSSLVYRPEFTPDESKILAHGYQQTVMKVWDARSGALLQELPGPAQIMHSAVSPDSRLAAVSYINGVVHIWSLADAAMMPNPVHVIAAHRGTTYNVDFDATGRLLATASGDAHVKVWRTSDWTLAADLDTHRNIVLLVRFSPDGQRILTGTNDNKLHLFDLSGRELLVLDAGGTFGTAEWSPDGKRILCTTTEGAVHVWTAKARS